MDEKPPLRTLARRATRLKVHTPFTGPRGVTRSSSQSVIEAPDQLPRCHEKRMCSWASQVSGADDATRFAMRPSIQFGLMPPIASSPSPMANGSCDGEDLLELRWHGLPMIDAVGRNAQSQRSDSRNCRFASGAICHHSRHGFDVGPPAAVVFLSQDDGDRFWRDCFHRSCAPLAIL